MRTSCTGSRFASTLCGGTRASATAALVIVACAAPAARTGAPPASVTAAAVSAAPQVDFCPLDPSLAAPAGAPSTDLYCIELIPPPDLADAVRGVVQLAPATSPFTVPVTRDGQHRFRTTFFVSGLPAPATFGAQYTTFVAWAAPPDMYPLTRLGVVRNGRSVGGELALNKYYILISAEASDTVTERRGPLVLRGLSASTRMRDPHFVVLGPAAAAADAHAAHRPGGWVMPPHDPRVPMGAMGIEHLVPSAAPFLPGPGGGSTLFPPAPGADSTLHAADLARIPLVRPRELMDVRNGDTIRLRAGLVRRRIKGRDVIMYAFNGQHPGPLVHVRQAATITVDFFNDTPHETAVHWHGIRLDNRFDGVPHVTQEPVPPGGSFRYTIRFPDAGIYWYHPHHREDIQQDLGLYGNLLVQPAAADYFGPAHREQVLMLDDILLGDDGLVPYGAEYANFAVMGRFGNVLLVNGEPSYALHVGRGEVVRFHLTNASNTRTFNVSFGSTRMKLVATDVGRFLREEWVESVVIAPAERYVVDVMFEQAGTTTFTNRVQAIDHQVGTFVPMVDTLGTVHVGTQPAEPDMHGVFALLRTSPEMALDVQAFGTHFDRAPDFTLDMMLEDRGLPWSLVQLMRLDTLFFNPVEWAGTMPMMDWLPTTDQVRWLLRDDRTGAVNEQISWRFRVGDVVRIRLRNQRSSLHAMQHPIHIHGQRFLAFAVNGVRLDNPGWKDTVLVPVGSTVDLLLELSNPGRWMLHCHIAEHLEAGMQFVFEVAER